MAGIKKSSSSGSTYMGKARARSRRQLPPFFKSRTLRPAISHRRPCTSARLIPALAQIAACWGPMATTMSERACMFHDPMAVMVSAIPFSRRLGSSLTSSKQNRGDSTIAMVMTFSSGRYPFDTARLSQGWSSMFSVRQ